MRRQRHWRRRRGGLGATGPVDEVVEMLFKDVEVGNEYIVGIVVSNDRSYERLVNLEDNDRPGVPCLHCVPKFHYFVSL